jgi:hypothetical protein
VRSRKCGAQSKTSGFPPRSASAAHNRVTTWWNRNGTSGRKRQLDQEKGLARPHTPSRTGQFEEVLRRLDAVLAHLREQHFYCLRSNERSALFPSFLRETNTIAMFTISCAHSDASMVGVSPLLFYFV